MSTTDTNLHRLADDLDACASLLGPLSTSARARLFAALDNPTEDTWDDAARIILNPTGLGRTLWQSVIAVDPTFPTTGPRTDEHGNRLSGWSRIPSAGLIREAITHATLVGAGR